MELPKNITQIGESDHRCKIYVEDYVISYMKQLNRVARDKEMAVALYGVRREENEVSYLFLYGACKLTFLQRETRHLSQAQQQEIEKCRAKYFREYTFLGYRLLNGEMIEGFHICEQEICRYLSGYAQFYEKNDSMLAYMLDMREEVQPEVVEQEKYEVIKKKQEERRIQHEENKYQKTTPAGTSNSLRGMRVAVVAVFALLCLVGLTSMNGGGKIEDLQAMARQVMDNAMEQRIPDAETPTEEARVDTLIAEDKLAEAVLRENEATPSVEQVSAPGVATVPNESEQVMQTEEAVVASEEATTVPETSTSQEPTMVTETAGAEDASVTEDVPMEEEAPVMEELPVEEAPVAEETIVEEPQPTSYIIKEGDTLTGISEKNYGSDARVSDICLLNQIENPDDIMIGQKILLP